MSCGLGEAVIKTGFIDWCNLQKIVLLFEGVGKRRRTGLSCKSEKLSCKVWEMSRIFWEMSCKFENCPVF
jgi:hypothetical protein